LKQEGSNAWARKPTAAGTLQERRVFHATISGNRASAELVFENIRAVVGKPGYTKEEGTCARALQAAAGYSVIGMDYPLQLFFSGYKIADGRV